jgi:hypothetical protein
VLPQLIAEMLVGVQPMQGPVGNMLTTKYKPNWEEWHSKIIIWPRRSINGKLVFGFVNRSSRDEFEVPFGAAAGHPTPKRFHRYATDKELFKARLEGTV